MRPASAPGEVQFGTRVALLAAVALLLAAVAACYGICAWKVVRPGKCDDGNDDR